MSEPTQPILPPEIEEAIFSLCARMNPGTRYNLALVAKRVHQWLLPQLYEVAIIHDLIPPGRPKVTYELLEKYGHHVRHFLFWDDMSLETRLNLGRCLSLCPDVIDVALWGPKVHYGKVLDHFLDVGGQLRRLSFDLSSFHSVLTQHSQSTPTPFPAVTHLEVMGPGISLAAQEVKEYFPSVTHLFLRSPDGLSIAKDVLEYWGDQLQVIILGQRKFSSGRAFESDSDDEDVPGDTTGDPRVVILPGSITFVQDWDDTTKDEPGSIWKEAEDLVSRSRARRALSM